MNKGRYSISWSFNRNRIYLYEDVEQINEVEIIFRGEMKELSMEEKKKLIKNIIESKSI